MSEKASSKKSTKSKKTARKAAAKKKSSPKKAGAKKAAVKKTAARKTVKKAAAQKKTAKEKPTAPTTKKAGKTTSRKKKAGKIRASDMMKKASHTPAIFKPSHRRGGHIVFTLEDVRELLKERAKEEKKAAKAETKAKKAAVQKAAQPQAAAKENPPVNTANEAPSRHSAASLDDILGLSTTSSVPNTKGPRSVPKKFKKYYALLIELRDQVRKELNLHSSDTLKRSQKEDAGDISISVDAGTDNFDRDFALSLLSSEQEALNEIEAAIERIHDGTYGTCQVTGNPIAPERLEAVPFTRFSLEGQRQHESTAHRRVDRQGAFLNDDSGEAIGFGDDDGDN